jgi:hypothetical protein
MTVDGVWKVLLATRMGEREATFDLRTSGDDLSGSLDLGLGVAEITDGKVRGNVLTWKAVVRMGPADFTATVEGDRIAGEAVVDGGSTLSFSGGREGATLTPITEMPDPSAPAGGSRSWTRSNLAVASAAVVSLGLLVRSRARRRGRRLRIRG